MPGTNPKDLVGSTKVSITKFPPIGTVMGSMAMMDGAEKYNAYNWRDNKVIASIYVDAAMRHLMLYWEGQDTASDSKVHHLGHTIACCAILLDAERTGNLIDDRPVVWDGKWFEELLDELSETIKSKRASKEANKTEPPYCTDPAWAVPVKTDYDGLFERFAEDYTKLGDK